jgi:hypothetical protein
MTTARRMVKVKMMAANQPRLRRLTDITDTRFLQSKAEQP